MLWLRSSVLFYVATSHVCEAVPTFQALGVPFKAPIKVASGFAAHVLFSNLTTPRGITFDSRWNLLVVERGFGVTAFTPTNAPAPGYNRTVVIQNANFTQGIQVDGSKLYVSTASTVYGYTYDAETKSVSGDAEVVVTGFPPDGDLTTHTLQLDGDALLIASGPLTNIDPTARDPSSGRSQIRRVTVPSNTSTTTPPTFLSGDLIAYGIRNPAGFAFSPLSKDKLYVVENGASIDNVTGLTAAFVNDNPADEVNLVSPGTLGRSFGLPDCTTLWNGSADPIGDPQYVGLPRGTQISLHLEEGRDDAWCRTKKNNVPPTLSFQAHSVPLDIKFYTSQHGNLSASLRGSAFVSFHGSFDRSPPTGYGVVHIPSDFASYDLIIQAANLTSCPGSCIRPVGLAFGQNGQLYVSSDSSGELFVIESA